ncbi:phospholipase [Pseudodesulfovibrio nedwellii]|uniref:Phospholipase n=1 Tax=Pseudodesulfovibrio nedwellii TaxID=2973072 RepID=A0ABM8AZP5_9BACT|nr:patatin-like phospholipase family protein [Pseudodesulfovibrio nedwellii]BDQ36831.1 phospholipase [Pseudodesulfovibrio nedwellii]
MTKSTKFGLVLSGGGAKGAYQAGVIKALAELNITIDIVSGASIGALNGAMVACAPDLEEAAVRLKELWKKIGEDSPLTLNKSALLKLLLPLTSIVGNTSPLGAVSNFLAFFPSADREVDLLSNSPIKNILEQNISVELLKKGLPLYVSVYPSSGNLQTLIEALAASMSVVDTDKSHFYHVQSLPHEEQIKALLASSALPGLLPAQKINDQQYHDGGIGGWRSTQGNTPITPLIEAGCTHAIVTHLRDGSMWRRQDFPELNVIEIRPRSSIQRGSVIPDVLGFDPSKVSSWIEQGYEDTHLSLAPMIKGTNAINSLTASQQALLDSHQATQEPSAAKNSAMDKFKRRVGASKAKGLHPLQGSTKTLEE